MLHLHDDLLGDLYHAIPFAEYDQRTAGISESSTVRRPAHVRWHSVDAVSMQPGLAGVSPKRLTLAETLHQRRRSLNISGSSDPEPVVLRCAPDVVAAIAAVFSKHV
jgi:hypothetical protein